MPLKTFFKVLAGVALALLLCVSFVHALPGDLNSSGRVDGHDLVSFGRAYGSVSGDENWNTDADMDLDGDVDDADLDILSTHFGRNGISFGLWAGTHYGSNHVYKLSRGGNLLRSISGFSNPVALAPDADGNAVWVAVDYNSQSVLVKLDNFDGSRLVTVSGISPRSVSIDYLDGSIWVADTYNHRILKLQPTIADGYNVGSDAGSHIAIGGFSYPWSISVDPENGAVWVADQGNNRIVRLDTDVADGYNVGSDNGSHDIITGFNSPKSVSVNISDGSVWVADTGNNQVVKISAINFTELLRAGGYNIPVQVQVNYVDGTAWVADQQNGRVVRLGPDGSVLAVYEGLNYPVAVAVNPLDGSCWTHDSGSVDQIVHLSPMGTELVRVGTFDDVQCLAVIPDETTAGKYPTATARLSDTMVDVGEVVTLTGTGTDPDGEIVKYEWDFNGDGTFEFSDSGTGTTTATYLEPGIYNPAFRVTDNDYFTATDYSQVLRVGSLTAVASADVTVGTAPLVVNFSGLFTDPIDGKISTYQWDFDGDATFDYYSESTGNIRYTYGEAGTYRATFKVTDGTATATDTIDITVNQASPVATAGAAPTSGIFPLNVQLTGTANDPDGTVILYEWDFDDDGNYDWHSTVNGQTIITLPSAGTYVLRLRVTDNDGLTGTDAVTVQVDLVPPTAVANADVLIGHAELTVNFNADGSTDADGSIVKYEWNFSGDIWTESGDGTASHTYTAAGDYTATLRVTDNDDNTATATVDITVVAADIPVATAGATPTTGMAGDTVNFTGSGVVPDGSIVDYHWNFGEEYVWVADASHDQVVRLYQDGSGEAVRVGGLDNPYAVAVVPSDGTVWAVDYYGDSLVRFSADGRSELVRVSGLSDPVWVDVDSADNSVWVASFGNGSIVKYSEKGVQLVSVSGFSYPWCLAVNSTDGSVWVADSTNNRIVKLDSAGNTQKIVIGFNQPVGISVNPNDGVVWVSDTFADQVVRIASDVPDGYDIGNDTGSHTVATGFNDPMGIDVDAGDGTVWVTDYYHHQVVHLSADAATELARVPGFSYPLRLSVNSQTHDVWVSDTSHHQVVKLDRNGTELARLGGFSTPRGICVAVSGAGNDYNSVTDGNTSHQYTEPGIYRAILTVTDDTGDTHSQAIDITIRANPTVTAYASVDSGNAPLEVFLSADAWDRDGTIALYEWDFDGDGSPDYSSTQSDKVRHVYYAGNHTATIFVTDTDGYTATDSVAIAVAPSPPVASADAVPKSGNAPLTVDFSGSGTDPDGSIATYEWDFEGNGFVSSDTGDETHPYNSEGDYTATLRVTDNDGLQDTDTVAIHVNPAGTPMPLISADPVRGEAPLDVCVYLHGMDSDGTVDGYEMDWEGDGSIDQSWAVPPTVFGDSMEYTEGYWIAGGTWARTAADAHSGSYSWTDSPGGDYGDNIDMSLTSATIDLSGASDPKLIFYHVFDFGYSDYGRVEVSGDNGANWTQIGYYGYSQTLTTWTRQVYDLSAYAGNPTVKIRFRVTTDTGTPADGWRIDDVWVGDCVLHTYDTQGIYSPTLTVTDNGGNTADAGERISVRSPDDATYIWVADTYHHQVKKLSEEGDLLATIHGFYYPFDVEVDPLTGAVWVSQPDNDRIIRLENQVPDGYNISATAIVTDEKNSDGIGMLFNDAAIGSGELNNGLVLDGSGDYVQILADPVFDVQSFTFEAWIKSTDTNGRAFFMRGNSSGGNELYFGISGTTTVETLLDNNGRRFTNTTTPTYFNDGQFHHVALVHDAAADTLTCYVDGVQYGDVQPLSVNLDFGGSDVLIGSDFDSFNGSLGNFWSGTIDDVRLWNTVRTGTEIADNMNAELTGSQPGLVSYWKLDASEEPLHLSISDVDHPLRLAADPIDGSVWVPDHYHHRVVRYGADGAQTAEITGLYYPQAVDLDPVNRTLWIADTDNHRIISMSADYTGSGAFREIGSTPDATANGNDGLVMDNSEITAGRLSGGMAMDGSGDYVHVPCAPVFDVQSFTVEAWVKGSNTSTNAIFMRGNDTGGDELYLGVYWMTTIECRLNGIYTYFYGSVNFQDGLFHHVALVYDADKGELSCYVDGTQYGDVQAVSTTLEFGSSDIAIGADFNSFNGSPGRYWPGVIDDVRFWNTARTGAEIASGKDAPLTGAEPGLVGYWKFDTYTRKATIYKGFYSPVDVCAVPSDNGAWVADYNHHQVVKVMPDGSEAHRVGGFYNPVGVSVNASNDMVWVADYNHHQVAKMTPDGTEIARLDGFYHPHDVEVNPDDGSVWVADYNHHQIVKLAADGTELARISGFYYPTGLSIDRTYEGPDSPPVASASADVTSGNVPLTVSFIGTGTDDDGTVELYEWDFDGDGVVDDTSGSSGNTSFTYHSPGIYNPVFRVTDNDGLSDYDSSLAIHVGPVTVTANAAPDQGLAPLSVTLNGVVSGLASGNHIVSYEWDFDGDGVYDYTSTFTPRVSHTYNLGGTWTAVLRVLDALGNHVYGSVTVTVEKTPPVANNYASPTSGNLPLTVYLNGAASDADGSIIRYEWDYDGDGAFDWFSETTGQTYFTYTTAGTYETRFRVTDNDGLTTTASKTVTVGDSQLAPTAIAAADATEGYAPFSVNFTGTGLDPDDGSIVLYEWDFDGDGTYDYSSADNGVTNHAYISPGLFNAVLQVTDADGLSDTDSLLITVKTAGTPTAVANADPAAGDVPLTVFFDADGSSDPDGDIVLYEWTFGNPVVWVVDHGNHLVRRFEGYDLDKTLTGFYNPRWVAVDPNDTSAWVTDYFHDQVVKLKADGSGEIFRISGFNDPWGISVTPSDGSVWVADHANHQVVKLSSNGLELARTGGFYYPEGLDVDSSDNSVWVADYAHHQVVKLSSDGTELVRISGFYNPTWVTVDQSDGSVWVADYNNNRVVKLSPDIPDGYHTADTYTPDSGPFTLLGRISGDTAEADGQLSGGLVMDGWYDYVQIPSNPALDVQSFTIEAWVKSTGVTDRAVFMRGNNSGEDELYFGFSNSNTIYVILDNGVDVSFSEPGMNFDDGSFYHVAVVHDADADTLTCYVNGAPYGDVQSVSVTLDFGNSDALIGADFDAFNAYLGNFWNGTIDDVRIWDVARSQAQINANKDAELTGSEDGLVGYWKCNALDASMYHKALGGFDQPHHISMNPSDQSVWVAEYNGARVDRVAKDCDRITTRIGGFNSPYSTYIPPGGESVWVVDQYAHQVIVMSFDGTILRRITGFYSPTGIAGFLPAADYFSSAETGSTRHTYPLTGEYEATLRVTDDDGNSDTDTVMIRAGIFPEALPAVYPTTGRVPMTVYFVSNGYSPTGTIEYFNWDFGDGSPVWSTRITDTVTHTYNVPGTYTATLTVIDNRNLSHSASAVITVLPPLDEGAPQAFASVNPSEGNAPLTVTLEGFGSDTDGFIRKFEWDYTNDGIYEFESSTTGIKTHIYSEPGSYTAMLRVTDDQGKTGTDTVVIQAKTADSPTASAFADPVNGAATLDVQFTGTGTDPDGSIVLYEWDFDGDGTYDYTSSTTATTSYSYAVPKEYNAVLRVTDNTGLRDTDTVNVNVSAGITATLSDDMFDPAAGPVFINMVLTADNTTVTVLIKNRVGEVIRTLVDRSIRSVGFYADPWDGRDDAGNIVRSGVYLYVIEYEVGGAKFVYDLTNNVSTARNTPSTVYPASFNPFSAETNFFRYTLDRKSEVTIYISPFTSGAGIRVKTLMLRKPQKAGSYVAVWDGTDDTGNLVEPGNYVIAPMAWDLPDNAIIVNKQPVLSDVTVSPGYLNPDARPYDETNFATFSFTLSKTADVTASIYDESNYIVKSITRTDVPQGTGNEILWDGKNKDGDYVPPGVYRIKLIARDADDNMSDEGNALMVVFY